MKNDVGIKNSITVPSHEIEITASRAGGPGGQHVNKANTRVTIRWNVPNTTVLNPEEKQRVLIALATRLTLEGDIIIHSSSSRSQLRNKEMALAQLDKLLRKALHIPKKRRQSTISTSTKEKRLEAKARHSGIKKMRSKKNFDND